MLPDTKLPRLSRTSGIYLVHYFACVLDDIYMMTKEVVPADWKLELRDWVQGVLWIGSIFQGI